MSLQRITILGSTGSIGQSTLSVVSQNQDLYDVFALCAKSDVDGIFAQIKQYQPRFAVLADSESAEILTRRVIEAGLETEILAGAESIAEVASHSEVDTVVAAIVGAAGLQSTMAAINSAKKVLLANKEALVCGGKLFMQATVKSGATLMPIDSEHNAIFQCLPDGLVPNTVEKIYLTGSGGPFRGRKVSELVGITPDQACAHPNWSMGKKISVDSATMMNKGLELIEACWLFGVDPDLIEIVLHPQSIVHSMVKYVDGSVLAQMGSPDMKTPIAHCLAWPDRVNSGAQPFDIFQSDLQFERPDFSAYPCLKLALAAAESRGATPLILNAANEIAVAKFLNREIAYLDISIVIEKVLEDIDIAEPQSIAEVIEQDQNVRRYTTQLIHKMVA